jgi:N-acetylneuraminic acid mutarotase
MAATSPAHRAKIEGEWYLAQDFSPDDYAGGWVEVEEKSLRCARGQTKKEAWQMAARRWLLCILLVASMTLCACSNSGITMSEKKMSFSAITVDGVLYVLGGMTKTGDIVADFAAYDPAQNKWAQLAPMPLGRAGAAAAHHGGRIYVFGGLNEGLVRQVDVFDIASGKWESAGDMPYEAWNLSAESHDGKIYLLGGISGTGTERKALDDVHIFDPEEESWTEGTPLPSPRHDAASALLDGRIYLIGGKEQVGANSPAVALVNVLDLGIMQWSELAPLPMHRVGMKGAVIGGKLYIAGGNSGGELLRSVDCYDPDVDAWTQAGSLSAARSGHAVAATEDVLYIIGGSLNIPKSASDVQLSDSIEAISFAQGG